MINVAVVGLGYWGPNFARVINESERANLLWCADLSRRSLKKIKNQYKYVKTTTRLEDVLQDTSVDALVVAVPAVDHFKVTRKALLSGKDVLVEKPLTSSQKDARILVKLAERKKRILMTDHIFLFNPAIQKIKELIDKDELGKIYYGHGTYTALGPVRIDVSAMWDLSIHFLYTVCYLFGQYPRSISAEGRPFLTSRNADVAFLNLEFGKNNIFNLKVSWIDPVKTRTIVLVGDEKMVIFDDSQTDKLSIFDRGVEQAKRKTLPPGYRFTFRYGNITLPHIESKEPLKEVFEHFIDAVEERKEPLVKPRDAANLVTLLEAAEYSLKRKGAKVKLGYSKKANLLSFQK